MRKIYKRLTQDQQNRGIIFSSCLSRIKTEEADGTMHEVTKDQTGATETIERLLNDGFFNPSFWKYNIIRQG